MAYISELEKVLDQELAVYRELLALAQRKNQALIDKRMQDVRDLQTSEARLIDQVAQLEPQRQALVRKLCSSCGLDAGNGYVTQLVAQLGAAGQPLQVRATALRAVIEELQGINAANAQRIRENVACLQGALDAIRVASAARENYDASGDRASRPLVIDGQV